MGPLKPAWCASRCLCYYHLDTIDRRYDLLVPRLLPLLSILNSSPSFSTVSADKNIMFLRLLGFIFTDIVIIGGEGTQN